MLHWRDAATDGDLWVSGGGYFLCLRLACASLLPDETPNRRRWHYLEGLIFQLQDEGPGSLKPAGEACPGLHRTGCSSLHTLLWVTPPPTAAQGGA